MEIQRKPLPNKHPLANCADCPLNIHNAKFVPSVVPEKAEVAFVGEAPGVKEARKGIPFTGPSGQLLDTVMNHHGIKREEVVLTNAVLCRPPDNSTPPKSAITACRPRLESELREAGVKTVVALGNSAAESLLGQSGVTKLRVGPGKPAMWLEGVRVIPTLHPAACLRQGDMFPHLVTDVGKVVMTHEPWIPPEYIVVDAVDQAIQVCDELERREGPFVIDIEVDIEKDTAYDHPNHYGMLCLGIAYERNKAVVFAEGVMGVQDVRDRLASLLRSKRLIGQNGKFDLAGLYPVLGPLELWFDTMLASYCFDERPGIHGLKHQAVEYLGAPQYDDEIKRFVGPKQGYGVIPRDLLYKYNATDVVCTYALWEMYEKKFESEPELRKVHDFVVAAGNQLMYPELNGIAVDREYLDRLDKEYLQELEQIELEISNIVRRSVKKDYDKRGGLNPRSPMQVKSYLADKDVTTDSTDEKTLKALDDKLVSMMPKLSPGDQETAQEVLDFVRTLLRHRREAKLHGTYVKGIRKRLYGGRVFPTFLLHGTTSGRLACRNPNLQNIPRESKIRRLYVPAKSENVFVQTDYSQAELRVLSYLARDTYFRDIFNDPTRDLFDELTPILYPELPSKDRVRPELWKETRIRVKAYVYGLAYGRSEYSIAEEFKIPVSEAQKGMSRFFHVIPEIVEFRNETKAKVLAGEDLVTPMGRHRRFTLITEENVKAVMNEALAFLPQSTASDMCLGAFINVRQDLKGIGWVRNLIHDAILSECHQDDVEEVKQIQERRMLESAQAIVGDYVRFAVETTVGKSWGDL